ncbi:MAG TPA: hypothetical protein VER11_34195 [Polyangiaceae bacterium]|nr:hypothetical protein [Polyangiaceae bacterium]
MTAFEFVAVAPVCVVFTFAVLAIAAPPATPELTVVRKVAVMLAPGLRLSRPFRFSVRSNELPAAGAEPAEVTVLPAVVTCTTMSSGTNSALLVPVVVKRIRALAVSSPARNATLAGVLVVILVASEIVDAVRQVTPLSPESWTSAFCPVLLVGTR